MKRTDDGSVSVLTPVLLCFAVLGGISIFRFGSFLCAAVAVKDIADITALACVDFGETGARQVAEENAAVLVAISREGFLCHVTVQHQNISAQSAATRDTRE